MRHCSAQFWEAVLIQSKRKYFIIVRKRSNKMSEAAPNGNVDKWVEITKVNIQWKSLFMHSLISGLQVFAWEWAEAAVWAGLRPAAGGEQHPAGVQPRHRLRGHPRPVLRPGGVVQTGRPPARHQLYLHGRFCRQRLLQLRNPHKVNKPSWISI